MNLDITKKKSTPYKVVNFDGSTKDIDMGSRVVTGMFNSFFYIDSDLDMLIPGSAKKSIQERGVGSKKGNKIKHLKDHNMNQVIARLDVLDERTVSFNGKNITGIYHESYYPESTESNDMLINIREGLYDSRSIGFRYMDLAIASKDGSDDEQKMWAEYYPKALNPEVADKYGFFWVVKEIMLFEGSDVAFGANELTPMLGTKSKEEKDAYAIKAIERLDRYEKMMREGNLSDEGFHQLNVEILQIKSIILNLTNSEPNLKYTTCNGRKDQNHSEQTNETFIF